MKSRSKNVRAGRTIHEQAERMMARLLFPKDHFPVAVDDWTQSWPHTNREQCMVAFMEEVTIEENWATKVFDDAFINAWEADVMSIGKHETTFDMEILPRPCFLVFVGLSHRTPDRSRFRLANYRLPKCIEELQEKAQLYQSTGIVPLLDMEARLARSDTVIPPELKAAFQRAALSIERVSTDKTGLLPTQFQTTDSILPSKLESASFAANLIDPALYPLINGRSRVLLIKEIGLDNCLSHIAEGITVPKTGILDEMFRKGKHVPRLPWSPYFQLLPCEVRFPDAQNAKIVSYVSNLHPQDHVDVYHLLEKIITKAMPLWNLVYCTIYQDTMRCDVRILCNELRRVFPGEPNTFLNLKEDLLSSKMRRRVRKTSGSMKRSRRDGRKLPTAEAMADYTTMLGGAEGIQVIVKLRAIYLTPERPVYNMTSNPVLDGAWNDHIVATALYFFDDENVTDSKISFQSQVNEEFSESFAWLDDVPGDVSLDELFGFKGVVYPPKHRIRRDPATGRSSRCTSSIRASESYLRPTCRRNGPTGGRERFSNSGGQFNGLPKEVVDMVVDNVTDFPIHRNEALRLRREYMILSQWELEFKVKTMMDWRRVVAGRREYEEYPAFMM
ncbi:DUF1665 domain containing protein [Colletotrichum plurivorum]|uniref:DUF1665 domain containing protein n=1 Tax=Colletotrichum plurivorum TaxID=2175906 RepID=A0A8H6JTR3_9PEZI|nr:DUF1665 domain containing protein [Colletotrichum plurivorum]